jgi:lysophospholipase L1-like esterase
VRLSGSDAALVIALALVTGIAALAGCTATEDPSPTQGAPSSRPPTRTATPVPAPSQTPSPTPSPSPPAVGTYLALGDSLAFGVGATRPAEIGYVGRLFRALSEADSPLHATALVNLAVGGETSTSMIHGGQLAAATNKIAAAEPPVVLVTLDIGGNDLLRLLGTEACAAEPLGPDCLQRLALTLDDFEANFRQVIGELTQMLDAHAPDATLAVMTYFNPFSGTDASHAAAGQLALLGSDQRLDCDAVDPQARGMNDIIACVGEELGAISVDVEPAFVGLGLELTHIASDDIHANDDGYEVIADAFLRALRSPREP